MGTSDVAAVTSNSLAGRLETFLAAIDDQAVAQYISSRFGQDEHEARLQFIKYKNEARFALRVVGPWLKRNARILEVGSGTGVTAYFLKSEGFDITALEPVGIGYDFMGAAFEAMKHFHPHLELTMLPIGAEALDPKVHGIFDLVFSIHVLEHLPDLSLGLHAMDKVVAPAGVMVHAFPNYYFPYDPHFGIPLIPFWPAMTRLILPRRISASGKWKSINFINAGNLDAFGRKKGYSTDYSPGVLTEMINRMDTDREFSKRHSGFAGMVIRLLKRLKILALIGRVPPRYLSPVIVSMSRSRSR